MKDDVVQLVYGAEPYQPTEVNPQFAEGRDQELLEGKVDGDGVQGDGRGEPEDDRHGSRGGNPSHADKLVDLALGDSSVELFHYRESSFATFADKAGGTVSTPVRSSRFKAHLRSLYFGKYRKAISSQSMQDAIGVLEARGIEEGEEHRIFVRVADLGDRVALDLGDHHGAVIVTTTGWTIEKLPPVRFIRPKTMRPLPEPLTGGSVDSIREVVNFGNGTDGDDQFRLAVGWLLAALSGRGPFPILEIFGEYDAGKTTMARTMKMLVDPADARDRGQPKDLRDLAIAARNNFILNYDNLSYFPNWLSDGFCRLATGSAFATRKLYSDDEEEVFDGIRPLIINGIPDVAVQGDLKDRCLTLELPPIAVGRDPDELERAFEQVRGRVLGALLTALSTGIAGRERVTLTEKVRMRGAARLVTAAETTLAWPAGAFVTTYAANRRAASTSVLDASVIAPLIQNIIPFQGKAALLLEKLLDVVGDDRDLKKKLPSTPQHLSGELRGIARNLRDAGIRVEWGHGRERRVIMLDKIADSPSPASPSSPSSQDQRDPRDDGDDRDGRERHQDDLASPGKPSNGVEHDGRDARDDESARSSDGVGDVADTIATLMDFINGNDGEIWGWLLDHRPDLVRAIDASGTDDLARATALQAGVEAWKARL